MIFCSNCQAEIPEEPVDPEFARKVAREAQFSTINVTCSHDPSRVARLVQAQLAEWADARAKWGVKELTAHAAEAEAGQPEAVADPTDGEDGCGAPHPPRRIEAAVAANKLARTRADFVRDASVSIASGRWPEQSAAHVARCAKERAEALADLFFAKEPTT